MFMIPENYLKWLKSLSIDQLEKQAQIVEVFLAQAIHWANVEKLQETYYANLKLINDIILSKQVELEVKDWLNNE